MIELIRCSPYRALREMQSALQWLSEGGDNVKCAMDVRREAATGARWQQQLVAIIRPSST